MADTPNLGMPELTHGEYNGEVTHNHALQILDLFAQGTVINHAQVDLPGAPAEGNAYIMSGAWGDGQINDIAHFYNGTWHYYNPSLMANAIGWKMFSQVNLNTYYWTGVFWEVYVPASLPAPAYGQAFVDASQPTQAVTDVPAPIDGFVSTGPVSNVTVDITGGVATFTVLAGFEGVYRIVASASILGTDNSIHSFQLTVDGVGVASGFIIDLSNNAIDTGSGSVSLLTGQTFAGEVFGINIDSGDDSTVTYIALSFNVERIDT